MTAADKTFPVVEVFGPTIQGEGALCGHQTHFVRFGGCGYRCTWCDSMHAVDPALIKKHARKLTWREIATEVRLLGAAPWVTFSGGDPVMWDLYQLCSTLIDSDYRIAVETQGQLWKSWLQLAHRVTVSPKPPSSGMANKIDYDILYEYWRKLDHFALAFKVVVFDTTDLDWAEDLCNRYMDKRFYLSAGTPPVQPDEPIGETRRHVLNSYRWLVEEALTRPALRKTIILPQMHVLVWGHEKGK